MTIQQMPRRGFIAKAIYAIASLISGTLAASVGTYLSGTPTTDNDTWSDAGELTDLGADLPQEITFERTVNDGWNVRTEKSSAWIILNESGGVTAFTPSCTHLGCAYRWDEKKDSFLCPCHGSEFGKHGEVLAGPARRPLDRYATKIRGQRLWLAPTRQG